MSASIRHICRNCNYENDSPFQFCPSCGQKNTDGKITFGELWSEFQDAVFNIESRTWRTFKALFVPGKLTLEYFTGKHRSYVHPLRLLLVTSVLFIIGLSFQGFQSSSNHPYNIKDRILENYERQRVLGILENVMDTTHAIFPEQETKIITDTILTVLNDSLNDLLHEYGDPYGDTINLNYYISMGNEGYETISKHDFLTMNADELMQTYKKDDSWWEQLIFKQKIKYLKDQTEIFAAMIGHITWAILLMMPLLALVFYILYIRHNYYYIQHLIFAFHLHAFFFLVAGILVAGMNVFPSWIYVVSSLIIALYVFISMWKVYEQSIFKTFLKFIVLTISYGVLFMLFLIGTILTTFLLF